jgi:cyclopropane fatty-acyl-phospholipid synthase-like methyltransferase
MLERVKNGDKLLDLGCAFGQELRQLVRYYRNLSYFSCLYGPVN